MKRFLLRALGGLVVAGAVVAGWMFWPASAAGEVAGLDAVAAQYDTTIVRDAFGVPHVFGATDADVAYGLAYANAEDDFLTIQQGLLAARGDLATIYGPDAAPNDYMVHLLRIWDVVDGGYQSDLSPEVRKICEAYADGLNHYAALHPDEALVGVFPITGKDVVAASVHKSPLFFGLESTLGELFEEGRANTVSPRAFADIRFGSNVMAVGPARTPNGETHFAANSHQPWTGPVTWYETSVHSESGWNFSGALFPGMPVFALGTNGDVAWSFTVNHADLVDVYVLDINPDDPHQYRFDGRWLDLEVREAPIEVRLAGRLRWTVTEEVLWSVYGPTIRRPDGTYAVRYAGMGTLGIYEQLYRMNRATSFDEWREPLRRQDGLPTFGIGYADRGGTIYYLYHGLLPVRDPHYDWQQYLPGDTSETLWTEYLPLDELPQVLDPPSGFIQNANSAPWHTTLDPFNPEAVEFSETLGIETYPTNRSMRALELLGGDPSITAEEFASYKFDTRYHPESDIARWRDRLVSGVDSSRFADRHDLDPTVVEAARRVLQMWDLDTSAGSRGAPLMITTLSYIYDARDRDDVDLEISQLTDSDVSHDVLEESFAAAVRLLIEEFGRVDPTWGELNRLRRGEVDLPVGGAPDVLHAVYGERQEDGTFTGVAGDSYVLLVTWRADGSLDARSVHQFGSATAHPASVHYADQAALFVEQRLKPVWLDGEAIRRDATRIYRPGE